ncbi:MAG: hypothetical protein ACRD8U_00635, partial [Pyrinomonadaceae bacterium]
SYTVAAYDAAGNASAQSSAASATTQGTGISNLAPNPSFETDPKLDYYTHGTATYAWATDAFHAGSRSLKVVSTQPAGTLTRWLSRTTKIKAVPGSSYTASVWLKATGVTNQANLTINFWDASLNHLGSYSSSPLTGTTGWTQKSVAATAPGNAAYLRVEFRLLGSGTIWADDVHVSK